MITDDLTTTPKLQINQLDTYKYLITSNLYFFYFF